MENKIEEYKGTLYWENKKPLMKHNNLVKNTLANSRRPSWAQNQEVAQGLGLHIEQK